MKFYSYRCQARYQAGILKAPKCMLESIPMQNIKQMFKSSLDWGCFHISVFKPLIVQGSVLYARENLMHFVLTQKYGMSRKKPLNALQPRTSIR